MSQPRDNLRRGNSSSIWKGFFGSWHTFIFQLILTLGLGAGVYFLVDGHNFQTGSPFFLSRDATIYQTDVSFIISAGLELIKFSSGACLGLISWRVIYILLEGGGISLREIAWTTHYNMPILPGWTFSRRWLATLISLLAIPSMIGAPFMNGAIGWTPGVVNDRPSQTAMFIQSNASLGWDRYQSFPETRRGLVLRAAGSAYAGSRQAFDSNVTVLHRNFPLGLGIPVNSTISELLIPFISVDSLEWINDYDLSPTLRSAITDDDVGLLNISSPAGTITRPLVGNTALLKDTPWAQTSSRKDDHQVFSYDFPNATIFNGERFVAVLVARPMDDKSEIYTCPTVSPQFGPLPQINLTTIEYSISDHPFAINCYAIARVKLRAGSYISTSSRVTAPGIAETVFSSTPAREQPIGDPLVREIFAAMPEVMANMVVINTTNAQMWGNLDGYVRGMLMLSYQETWNAMTVEFERRMRETVFNPPREIVTADVSGASLATWVVINMCVVLAGILLLMLQAKVEGKPVRSNTIAALTMDLAPLLRKIPDLGNITELRRSEKGLGRLRFSGAVGAMRQVVEAEAVNGMMELDDYDY
ncbi:hypothetical protein V492_03234 [Pseudogymnoascus sp. VKM F-4246]|nr:hypothetical protein V492_03234 [Pseudogymnoascus sp. VKM F-4246]